MIIFYRGGILSILGMLQEAGDCRIRHPVDLWVLIQLYQLPRRELQFSQAIQDSSNVASRGDFG